MLANPTGVAKKQKSYLQQWLPEEGVLKKCAEFDESLSALAVRDDGRFIAVGTMFGGSVLLYVAFSLQVIIMVNLTKVNANFLKKNLIQGYVRPSLQ